MRQANIMVRENKNGIQLIYKGKKLAYKIFEKNNQTTPVVTSKQLNECIDKEINKSSENDSRDRKTPIFVDKNVRQYIIIVCLQKKLSINEKNHPIF